MEALGRAQKRFTEQAIAWAPGLLLSLAVALVALVLAPFTPFPAVATALLVGMLLAPVGTRDAFQPGIAISVRNVLRIGVAILGAQVTAGQLVSLGPKPFVIAVSAVMFSLAAGYLFARALRLSREFSWVSAAAVAICGASAALAVSATFAKSDEGRESAALAVAGITVIGTLAMIGYPLFAEKTLLSDDAAGVFLGASLHEVVQAVGAGFSLSDSAGEAATTVKLVRVACLAPVIVLLSWYGHRNADGGTASRPPLVPRFLIAFVIFGALSSFGVFSPTLLWLLAEASRLCLLVAIAALGMRVSLRKMLLRGPQPIVALLGQTAFIAVYVLGAIFLLGLP